MISSLKQQINTKTAYGGISVILPALNEEQNIEEGE